MTFYVELSPVAQKFLDKLDNSVRIPLVKRIKYLETDPSHKGKTIGDGFRELRYEKFRVYFDIMHDVILIEKIEYEGKVNVLKIGDKNSQDKDIKQIKGC